MSELNFDGLISKIFREYVASFERNFNAYKQNESQVEGAMFLKDITVAQHISDDTHAKLVINYGQLNDYEKKLFEDVYYDNILKQMEG